MWNFKTYGQTWYSFKLEDQSCGLKTDELKWDSKYLTHGGLLEGVDAGVEDVAPHLADVVNETTSLSLTRGRRGCDEDQRANRPAIHRCCCC